MRFLITIGLMLALVAPAAAVQWPVVQAEAKAYGEQRTPDDVVAQGDYRRAGATREQPVLSITTPFMSDAYVYSQKHAAKATMTVQDLQAVASESDLTIDIIGFATKQHMNDHMTVVIKQSGKIIMPKGDGDVNEAANVDPKGFVTDKTFAFPVNSLDLTKSFTIDLTDAVAGTVPAGDKTWVVDPAKLVY